MSVFLAWKLESRRCKTPNNSRRKLSRHARHHCLSQRIAKKGFGGDCRCGGASHCSPLPSASMLPHPCKGELAQTIDDACPHLKAAAKGRVQVEQHWTCFLGRAWICLLAITPRRGSGLYVSGVRLWGVIGPACRRAAVSGSLTPAGMTSGCFDSSSEQQLMCGCPPFSACCFANPWLDALRPFWTLWIRCEGARMLFGIAI